MKKALVVAVALFVALGFSVVFSKDANAALGGQVFYKFGTAKLKSDRAGEIFTDTLGLAGYNNNDKGSNIGAGLDIPLTKLGPGTLLGEVMLEYSQFSKKTVLYPASEIVNEDTGGVLCTGGLVPCVLDNIVVSSFSAVVAPKYRFELLDGKVRPWVIPIGLAFIVNSPPSDGTTYLNTGLHFGVGVEYVVHPLLSVGVDYRMTRSQNQADTETSNTTMGGYIGINF